MMMMFLVVAILASLHAPAGILANSQPTSYYYNSLHNGGYSYNWNVLDKYSGNDYGHQEDRALSKSGLDETKGSYSVLLPDGRVQTVTYYVDPYNGYQAKVLYDGEVYAPNEVAYAPQASYPQNVYQPAPPVSYKPAPAPPVTYKPAPAPLAPAPYKPFTFPTPAPYKPAPSPVPAPYRPAPSPAPVTYTTVAPTTPPPTTTTTPAPVEVKSEAPAVYTPVNYQPAPLSYPHNPVYNLVVPEYEHHKIKHIPEPTNVHPLAPPPSHKKESHEHDPYYKTGAELSNYDFSGPFFYSSTKHIIRKEKKDGKPKSDDEHGHEKPKSEHTRYRYY